ncbi:MAG: response regulator [Candidatus Moranbacteria bacterium]|nr:response regulator [Candidatus Moranbacteria bacterium]
MNLEGKKILLVEDDPDQIEMYVLEAELKGLEILNAKNESEALELAKQEQPDLILLDMLLGEDYGMDVLKKLKSNDKTKNIKVLFLTNFKKKNLIEEAKEAGAEELILKADYVPSQVIEKIEKYL